MTAAVEPGGDRARAVATRLAEVRGRIEAAGGDLGAVSVLAVTKGFGAWAPLAARDAGLADVGENYAQELEAKAAEVAERGGGVEWHAIGRLQRNKVKGLAPIVSRWDSVDRAKLAGEIARRAPGARVLVQVNVSEEPQKGGVEPAGAAELVAACTDLGLVVEGLMTVGATGSTEAARPGFAALRRLVDELALAECSMGMSGDLEAAVAEGSTQVRIGTALFGDRPPR